MTHTKKQQPGKYTLSQRDDIIVITLSGKINGQLVTAMSKDLEAYIKKYPTASDPAVLIDASNLRFRDVDSTARTESRRLLGELPIGSWAVYGKAHIGMLVDYLGQAAGIGSKMHYFSDKQLAYAWLRGEVKPTQIHSSVALVVAIAIALIGSLGLLGWQLGNDYLTSFLPHLRPINPVAAFGLVALSVAFFCYWLNALKPLRILGMVGIGLGVTALLPINIDYLLYSDAVTAAGAHTQLADSAAICFILSGLLGLLANRKGAWVQTLEYILAGLMAVIAFFNVYGQLYAQDFIYGLSDSFVMAFNLAIAFCITSIGMIILVILRRRSTALQRITRSGWLIMIVLVLVQMATYTSWVQTKARVDDEASHTFSTQTTSINDQMNTRLQAYVSALHGFRGLFAASNTVSQGDFEAYYSALNLKETYPGVRAIAFIAAVKTEQLPAFVAERRADTSLNPAGNPQFKVIDQTTEPLHFIAAYTAATPTTAAFGRDLTSVPGRSTIYNNALKSSGYYSSGTITFAASATQPATKGFFIATPVRTATSPDPIGIVSANFNYKDFFGAILRTIDNEDLSIIVSDNETGEKIYTSGTKPTEANALSQKLTVNFAQNQWWQVDVRAPADFGISNSQDRFPNAVLFFGHLFTLLLAGIFIQQLRARSQALALADAVTEDLKIERDTVSSLHTKDEAILAGIGEGLIVVDPTGKIEIVNAAALKMLNLKEDEMIGKDVFETIRALDEKGEVIPQSKRPYQQVMRNKKTVVTRLNYILKDYRQLPVKVTVSPIMLRGELIGSIEVFSDITKEKQLEHMKDEFLSVASHELRTPMGAIRANLSMILGGDYGPVNKDIAEPLTDMKASTIRLVELVNDLLNVARIEAGRMRFELKDFNIADVAKTVVTDLSPLGKEKGVDIKFTAGKAIPQTQGDVDKVKQVLTNLVGNSLKFTDKGSITVGVKTSDDLIEVTVVDTGIGITPVDQVKLFGKFNQITSAQAGKPAGTGLGLYISREMVRRMGGDMWIKESKYGKGSTFAFTVPCIGTPSAKKAKQAVDQEAKLHPDQV